MSSTRTVRLTAPKAGGTRTLKVEADGCLVLVTVGLSTVDGQTVTRVDVSPDDESRGGDPDGRMWYPVPHESGIGGRVIQQPLPEVNP